MSNKRNISSSIGKLKEGELAAAAGTLKWDYIQGHFIGFSESLNFTCHLQYNRTLDGGGELKT
jgi:hypothetical protein